ncbi:hypothetical protein [Parasitella parasitica]|uniref:CCHC-type domain-containing protein n=1 Tax=Parasitella parasitica TaxID=35722 RepID=A0A0B7N0K9_9FUNG|nr:hypothetical protein [Parasitella parasitica]
MTTYASAATNSSGEAGNNSMKATNLVRFLNDPKDFSGQVIATRGDRKYVSANSRVELNPLVWLKKLERLRDLARLNDKELLLIAADHLVGKAEMWFDISCSNIMNWSEFSKIFKKKFCTGLEDVWWGYIYHKKQSEDESVEDVDIELRELYSLVGLKDEHLMVRHFMDAIHKSIAWEVERKAEISSSSSLEQVVEAAIKAEAVMKKYNVKCTRGEGKNCFSNEDSDSDGESSMPIAYSKEETLSTNSNDKMDRLLEEFNDLKISMLKIQNSSNNRLPPPSASRAQICFYCNEPGHIKTNCEKFKTHMKDKQPTPATGANTEPINSGKGREHLL